MVTAGADHDCTAPAVVTAGTARDCTEQERSVIAPLLLLPLQERLLFQPLLLMTLAGAAAYFLKAPDFFPPYILKALFLFRHI